MLARGSQLLRSAGAASLPARGPLVCALLRADPGLRRLHGTLHAPAGRWWRCSPTSGPLVSRQQSWRPCSACSTCSAARCPLCYAGLAAVTPAAATRHVGLRRRFWRAAPAAEAAAVEASRQAGPRRYARPAAAAAGGDRAASPGPGLGAAGAKALARAVRAVPLKLITVGKGNSAAAEAMAGEWADKVRRYTQLEQVAIRPNPRKAAAPAEAVRAEGERVLRALKPQDRVVLCDERGRQLTSEGMAQLIAQAGDSGAGGLVFCIGGPYGHAEAVRARADDTIRLSNMVLNHQVAAVVLLEQVYRAWTILRGEPYHH